MTLTDSKRISQPPARWPAPGRDFMIRGYGDENIRLQHPQALQLSALELGIKVGVRCPDDGNAQIVENISDSFQMQLHPGFAGIVEGNHRRRLL